MKDQICISDLIAFWKQNEMRELRKTIGKQEKLKTGVESLLLFL